MLLHPLDPGQVTPGFSATAKLVKAAAEAAGFAAAEAAAATTGSATSATRDRESADDSTLRLQIETARAVLRLGLR
jgi:hypothetical protein